MAKASKPGRTRKPQSNRDATKHTAVFRENGGKNEVDEATLRPDPSSGDTVVFVKTLKVDVAIVLWGPNMVLRDPAKPSQPAGAEAGNVRVLYMTGWDGKGAKPTLELPTDGTPLQICFYKVMVNPANKKGDVGDMFLEKSSGHLGAGQDPEIIISG
jgi:hypothetical protein